MPPEYTIVAVDPGGTTGIAVYQDGAFSSWEIDGPFLDQCEVLAYFMGDDETQFVCEAYTITERTARLSQQHEPLMLIGVLQYISGGRTVLQTPSHAKGFSTDEKLKALGWHRPSKGGHANDAARHLLKFLVDHQLLGNQDMQRLLDAA